MPNIDQPVKPDMTWTFDPVERMTAPVWTVPLKFGEAAAMFGLYGNDQNITVDWGPYDGALRSGVRVVLLGLTTFYAAWMVFNELSPSGAARHG
jgi:hypothetical protein